MAVWESTRLRMTSQAVLLLLVLHIILFCVTCDAQPSRARRFRPLTDFSKLSEGSWGSDTNGIDDAASSPHPLDLTEGVRYRPPIINMRNQGGPVMWKPIHLYFVWYGTWSEAQKNVVRTAARSLTPTERIPQFPNLSNLWTTITQYYQEPQTPGEGRKYATNSVSVVKEVHDDYSIGKNLSVPNSGPTDGFKIVLSHIGKGLPSDLEQGIYFVFTAGDVRFDSGGFCGFHDDQCVDQSRIGSSFCDDTRNHMIYSVVPLPSDSNDLIRYCDVFYNVSKSGFGIKGVPPNYKVSPDGALDNLITVALHELLETAVDPYPNERPAWLYNITENAEVSDFCSWSFKAGDWYYCYLPDPYYDFPGVFDRRCGSGRTDHKALKDPKSHTTFNVYGIHGSKFIVQLVWSLTNKGCVSQMEEACAKGTVVMSDAEGTIQRGVFFKGVGVQRYAPGQNCRWKIQVHGAKAIKLIFEVVALGWDDLDYVTVAGNDGVVKRKVTRFGKHVKVEVAGEVALIQFVTFGGRSPYPSSAGFILHYEAEY